jgi:hypothetical protein
LNDTRSDLQPSLAGRRPCAFWVAVVSLGLLWGCATAPAFKSPTPAPAKTAGDALALVAEGQLRIEMGELAEGLKLIRKAVDLAL